MKKLLLFILPLVFLSISPPEARGDFYKYVDENGTVHITNVPTSKKYVWAMREKGGKHGRDERVTVYSRDYDNIIQILSIRHGVDPALVKAIVRAESDFNATAISKKGARGLMQLMPETASILGVRDIHDPYENVEGGIRHLSKLLKMFNNNVRFALAAYNAGENAVLKYGSVPPYPETREYVKRILAYYKGYNNGMYR